MLKFIRWCKIGIYTQSYYMYVVILASKTVIFSKKNDFVTKRANQCFWTREPFFTHFRAKTERIKISLVKHHAPERKKICANVDKENKVAHKNSVQFHNYNLANSTHNILKKDGAIFLNVIQITMLIWNWENLEKLLLQ